jgi:type III secretion control protein HpaP
MPIIDPRPLRIIAAQLDARELTERGGARRFDYAALARRGRTRPGRIDARTDGDEASDAQPEAASVDRISIFGPVSGDDSGDSENNASALGENAPERQGRELAERISRTTLPIVDAMYRTQGQFLELAAKLANEVASFCGDPSITANGNWNVQLPLDSKIVPDTVLYLSLSSFHLSLRFDTQSAQSRRLLLDHSTLLERELGALLRAWNTPRDIELTVW